VKSEVVNWVLKKPSLDHRIAIEQTLDRALKALPHFLSGDMDKATLLIHTSKPPRPKPPRPPQPESPPSVPPLAEAGPT
jgi:PTH1 family peptidyl-tRNA hydrolase